MRYLSFAVLMTVLAVALFSPSSYARDAARDLKRMVGYTIIDAASVRSVNDGDIGGKVLVLDNGMVLKVQMLLLPPLPLTDVSIQ